MVRKSDWSDKQLEELLKSMPKIEDHRDPRDIYQNIQLKLNQKKKRSYVIPSIATAAAILLFVVLAPNLLNWNQSSDSTMQESTAMDTTIEMKSAKEENSGTEENENAEIAETEESDVNITAIEETDVYTALYPSDITNENVFTFAIPDTQAQNMVPVTVTVPLEEGKTALDQYKETMAKLDEAGWGLDEYFPLNADLTLDQKTGVLNVSVPPGHSYGHGSGSEIPFHTTIITVAKSLSVEKVALFTGNEPGIEFGNYGVLPELDLSSQKNRAYYFYYPNENTEKPYLVPYKGESYANIEEAILAMKNGIDTHGLKASIPEHIVIDRISSSKEQVLTLQVNEDSVFEDEPAMIQMIEAILLTAKDFQYNKVILEYSNGGSVGKFNFNEEIDVPLAPNKKTFLN